MIDMEVFIARASQCLDFIGQCWVPHWLPAPGGQAAIVIVAGGLLTFWGARLLRTIYVLAFIAIGAAIGIRLARYFDVELLIGLILGAGLLGCLAHLLYRMWVASTAAMCAVLVVALVGASPLWDTVQSFFDSYTPSVAQTPTLELVGGEETPPPAEVGWGTLTRALRDFGDYMWAHRRSELTKLGFLAAVAGVLGWILGLVFPRFTTVVGTSVIGVLLLFVGFGGLLSRRYPVALDWARDHQGLVLVAAGLCTLLALSFQARRGCIRMLTAPAAAEPQAASPA